MKVIKNLLFLLVIILLFNSCRKDTSGPSSSQSKVPLKIENLTVKSTFDWKTTTQYKFTLTSKSSNTVVFVTPSGSVNKKSFLTGNSPLTVTIPVPSYQKTIHLLFKGHDVELELTSLNLSYSFNY